MHIQVSLALALALAGCGMDDHSQSSSPPGSRAFTVTGFDTVSLAGSDDVEVTAGPAFAVTATGPQAVLDRLNIRVEGTELKIDRTSQSGWNWSGKGAMIHVTMPAIAAASIAGSGNMRIDKAVGPAFAAHLTGSGDMMVNGVKTDSLKAKSLSVTGSGSLDGDGLTATDADVTVTGSGDAALRVTGHASGSVAGSGDINITGTSNCAISKAGSGEVSCQP
jgi:hypothetical protein